MEGYQKKILKEEFFCVIFNEEVSSTQLESHLDSNMTPKYKIQTSICISLVIKAIKLIIK